MDTIASPLDGDACNYVRATVPPRGLRVAIVHEWLDQFGGSERVLEQLLLCFPQAELFSIVDFMPDSERGFLDGKVVRTSFIQSLPFARRGFRNYLGLMPLAIQQFDMSGFDLVISSNHAVAKGVLTGPDQIHVCYAHTPMRYAWDLQHQYLHQAGLEHGLRGLYTRYLLARLRQWDVSTSHAVDHFVANSSFIARRIRKLYRREASVIHPPADLDHFRPAGKKEDFFLVAGRFVPYKRTELLVSSFAAMPDRRLVVVGDGPHRARIRAAAEGAANIEFRGSTDQAELIALMQAARGFVFAAEEDFGISMVEAQACGTPVIAFGRGGARDIVIPPGSDDDPTGVFFMEQHEAAIADALARFEKLEGEISPEACRANAERFAPARFRARILATIARAMVNQGNDAEATPRMRGKATAA